VLIPQVPHKVVELEVDGKRPYGEWLRRLKDPIGKAAAIMRVRRIQTLGNFGKYRYLDDGVFELKIDTGPGYRIYFGLKEGVMVLLLLGGDKSSQERDISRARKLWLSYAGSSGGKHG
jgi:putative addiction module killer protein